MQVHKRFLSLQVKLAEHWSKKERERLESMSLNKIGRTLNLYHKKGLIDDEEFSLLKDMINHLIYDK